MICFLFFLAFFYIPIFFSNMNYNYSNLLRLKNIQQQVTKAFCNQKLFWTFTVWTKGAFTNYVYYIWLFLITYPPFYGIKVYKKSGFLTTYPPPLVNAVCERPHIVLVISKILQILGLQPRTSKVFLDHQEQYFLTIGQNNFRNKILFTLLRW